MGNCKYCGKPAGFLRVRHLECEEENRVRDRATKQSAAQITSEAVEVIKGNATFSSLEASLFKLEDANRLPSSHMHPLLVHAWEIAVDSFLQDGVLDASEEQRLVEFKEHFGLSTSDLDTNGALTKTAKSAVLRDILEGKIPQRINLHGSLPINLQKQEKVVWVFPDSKYLEDKTSRQYVGGSKGVSIRVMKGVYYRVGSFKGQAVENTMRVHVDNGLVVATDVNLYFAGPRKSFRVPYKKIVSFEPFEDGIGIMRDASSAKPQIFVTGDGWFTYNLVVNLSSL